MSKLKCVACDKEIAEGAQQFNIDTFLDPWPPSGVACSERCKKEKDNESRVRALLLYNSPLNPYDSALNPNREKSDE